MPVSRGLGPAVVRGALQRGERSRRDNDNLLSAGGLGRAPAGGAGRPRRAPPRSGGERSRGSALGLAGFNHQAAQETAAVPLSAWPRRGLRLQPPPGLRTSRFHFRLPVFSAAGAPGPLCAVSLGNPFKNIGSL
ncbi:bone morphogenetic protein 8A [Platysternon megacephalum]|uniref:Bone morphogenetic protein 8A n=1 Tax=Platysternon megacephalum TaxID=55544 RepID=A0A4D9F7L8_9SAUR|nr:bone morphogenetic protein 8A [Platysternon megacephalum]